MESLFDRVVRLLNLVHSCEVQASFRHRFASEDQWAEEAPAMKKIATDAWQEAKTLMCEQHDQLEFEIRESQKDKESNSILTIRAAQAVIKNEMDSLAEKALTSEE